MQALKTSMLKFTVADKEKLSKKSCKTLRIIKHEIIMIFLLGKRQ